MYNVSSNKMLYNQFGKTGMNVSLLGFGGSPLAHVYNTEKEDEAVETVHEALRSGINYIDTAPWYGFGTAEIVLGKALKNIPRDSYYLATKVGRYMPDCHKMFDFSAERTILSVDESLQRIGVDSFDVIQVHDLEFASSPDIIVNETLPALQKIKERGKAKFIGITGYSLEELQKVLEKSKVHIDVVLSYCRCTLFDKSFFEYLPVFKEKELGIVNAAVLGMGLLTNNELPSWHPVTEEIKVACKSAVYYCQKRNVDIAKLATRYSCHQIGIDTNLIGMNNLTELQKNLNALYDDLTSNEEEVLSEILERFFMPLQQTHWEGIEVARYWKKIGH